MADLELDVYEDREGSGPFGPKLLRLAKKAAISTEVLPLKVGDIRFVSCDLELVGIERKSTDSDLFTSMTHRSGRFGSRLVDQCRRLAEASDVAVLLIDGPIYIGKGGFVRGTRFQTRLRYSSLCNQLFRIQKELGVLVMQIQTRTYTARWVLDLYRNFQKTNHTSLLVSTARPFPTGLKMSPQEERLRILMAIEGVGAEVGRRIQQQFPTIKDVAEASIPDLTAVHGVGSGIAAKILDVLSS